MVLAIYLYMFACYVCTAMYEFTLLAVYIGLCFGCCLTLLQKIKLPLLYIVHVLKA